ncbi:MAG: T9SS type A sorting domain-containing protein [Lewinellaceae bacterium]|nr:T9SS type A sorting domain-containing protein [Lewinellaceae bacterium]
MKAIDEEGNVKELSIPAEQDTVWIKLQQTTGATIPAGQEIAISPNPARESVTLYTGDLQVEMIEGVNTLGQVLYSQVASGGRSTRLDISAWQEGIYTLRIKSDRGVIEKRLLVK